MRSIRKYSEDQVASTLLILEQNGFNSLKTSRLVNIPRKTIEYWHSNFSNENDVDQWLHQQNDTLLQVNLDAVIAFAANGTFGHTETMQLNWFVQKFHDKIQRRMTSPDAKNMKTPSYF